MASAPTQKNKRLSQGDRNTIISFACKQVTETQDSSALDTAYNAAADAIHAKLVAEYPPKDMKVLQRYGCAQPDRCIYISTGGYNYDRFEFREGDERIVVRPDRNCNRQPILLEGTADAAYDAYKASKKSFEEAGKTRLSDFKALIYGTQSFNALAEAWPGVEVMREAIVGSGSSLVVLSSEVVDRIKSDPAFAQAEAA